MSAPPPDAPPPEVDAAGGLVSVDGGLAEDPSAASLCGFRFPPFPYFKFGFNLPPIAFPPKLPFLKIALGINCDLNNPLSVSASVAWGGGRTSNADPDPDALEQQP